MKTDALEKLRLWVKSNVEHGTVEPKLIVKDGVVVDCWVGKAAVTYHLRPTELKEEEQDTKFI